MACRWSMRGVAFHVHHCTPWDRSFAQLADAASFAVAVARFRISHEGNGVAVALYRAGGLDAVLIAKGIVIVVAVGIRVIAAHRYPKLLVMGGAAATFNPWSIALLS